MDKKADELDRELEDAEVERVGEGIKVTFDSGILFAFDSAEIQGQAEANLTEFANTMKDFEGSNILIVGHTDAKGPADYNQNLSEERARSAATFLIRQGLAGDRIETTGKGEAEPVATNETAAGRQQNRRVEVAIYASEEYRERVKERAQSGEGR
jgi:outer membrane protein OmpA-like peptidoglycan-associated protein